MRKSIKYLLRLVGWSLSVGVASSGVAHAASFDCAKAQSWVEQVVCGRPELSQLDDELSESYKIALQDKAKAREVTKDQRTWLKEVGECGAAECVVRLYTWRVIELQSQNARNALTHPQSKLEVELDRKKGFKGKYFLTQSEDLMCEPFTKNLNEFRTLDFDECHPRLSEKFPEFSRPEWKEIPLDLEIAEKAFRDLSLEYEKSKVEMTQKWQRWLNETADLRAAGQVKMWLTDVDINHDGIRDPIARVQYAHPASGLPIKQRGCVYSHSGLRFLGSSPELFGPHKHFYFSRDADIIYSSKTDHSYSVEWSEGQVGPILDGQKIGATRGVLVDLARESRESPGPVCYINWVPTGSYRPLQRNNKSNQSKN